jgi:integrase
MARRPSVRYYASKGAYFTEAFGGRTRLSDACEDDSPDGPNYLAALQRFRALMEGTTNVQADLITVDIVVASYCDAVAARNKASGRVTRSLLNGAEKAFDGVPVNRLKAGLVVAWVDSHADWNECTRLSAWEKFKAALAWGVEVDKIPSNPLAGAKTPTSYARRSRGKEFLLEDDLVALLLQEADPLTRDLLTVLWRTGARPAEVLNAEAFNYEPRPPVLAYYWNAQRGYIHKTARTRKHGNRHRIIYLDPIADAIIRPRAERGGLLFRTKDGKRIETTGLDKRMDKLRNRPAILAWCKMNRRQPEWIVPYSFRHTWITRAIARGMSIKKIADMVGNSVKAIEEHYAHGHEDRESMSNDFLSLQ